MLGKAREMVFEVGSPVLSFECGVWGSPIAGPNGRVARAAAVTGHLAPPHGGRGARSHRHL